MSKPASRLLPDTSLTIPAPPNPKPPGSTFQAAFAFGDHVRIDTTHPFVSTAECLTGVVTGVCWKSCDGHTIEVSWIYNGQSYAAWFQPWRLQHA